MMNIILHVKCSIRRINKFINNTERTGETIVLFVMQGDLVFSRGFNVSLPPTLEKEVMYVRRQVLSE